MLVECYHCHVKFNRKPSEISARNFCSRKCLVVANKQDKSLNPNYRGGSEVSCDNCGKGVYLVPCRKTATINHFCSKGCQGEWTSRNLVGESSTNYKGGKRKSYCQMCDKEFKHYGNKLFCSHECKALSQMKINILYCEQCNKEYIRRDSIIYWADKRGYKHKFCSKDCSAAFHVGENSPNWVKDRSKLKSENRCIRYSSKMKEWRLAVFKRDDYTCVKCGDRSRKGHGVTLNAHHIKRFADFPELRFDVTNGATLCIDCHSEVTGQEKDFENILYETINKRREEMASANAA